MNQMSKVAPITVVTVLLLSGLVVAAHQMLILLNDASKRINAVNKELVYAHQANALSDVIFKEGVPVRTQVITDALKEIDKNVAIYFPNGPFTRNDFIAMAWLESEFKQYEVGTHGEKGIFQIMPCEFKDYHVRRNYYNIDVNTAMAFKVLALKYDAHPDYKKAIIAYNGVVKLKSGRWSEKYWNSFYKRKLMVDLILKQTNG